MLEGLVKYLNDERGYFMRLQIKDHWGNAIYPAVKVGRDGITFKVDDSFKRLRGLRFYGRVVGSSIDIGSCPAKDGVALIAWEKLFKEEE